MGSIHGPDPSKETFGADHSMSVYRDYKGNMLSRAGPGVSCSVTGIQHEDSI